MTRKKNQDSSIAIIDKATDSLDDTFFESNALETDNISNIIRNHGVIGIDSALTPSIYEKRMRMNRKTNFKHQKAFLLTTLSECI